MAAFTTSSVTISSAGSLTPLVSSAPLTPSIADMYLCDTFNQPLNDSDEDVEVVSSHFKEGDRIRVCIVPDESQQLQQQQGHTSDSFQLTQTDISEPISPSQLECHPEWNMCVLETTLDNRNFFISGKQSITLSGKINLVTAPTDTDSKGNLRGSRDDEQQQSQKTSVPLELSIPIQTKLYSMTALLQEQMLNMREKSMTF